MIRQRWRIIYKGEDFAVNVDTLMGHPQPGPYLEIKSRTWGRQDADAKDSDLAAKTAIVASARANLARLEAMESFKRLVAQP